MNAAVPVLVLLVMVAVNALYVAAEFATVGSRRSRVQELADAGNRGAAGLLEILKDPRKLDNYVAACQVGITLSSLLAGSFGQSQLTPLLTPYFGAAGQAVAVLIVLAFITVLQVVLGELLPKTVALRYPERLAIATLAPMQFSLWLFTPLIRLFNGSAFALLRRWGLHSEHSHAHVHSPEELEGLYRESAAGGLIDVAERDMLAGVLNVEQRVVRAIMTPRTRLVTIPAQARARDILPQLTGSAYSRFPVMGEGPDELVGIVHLRHLFLAAAQNPEALVGQVMQKPLIVSELMTVPDLWQTLREAGRHSAMIVNEYGSVAGMVTLEDALEEIFGELQDEFDQEEDPIVQQGQAVSVRGDVLLEALNDRFDLNLAEDEVDTVSGLMWQELGRLPVIGDEVQFESGLVLRVESMDRRSVRRVGLMLPGGEA
ncbi:hemolysin family protein [Deinococcus radiophilus]|uniref:HlyC/CorC family transporter n=1 Tax=Deinococcus radiophilus TaxID=32062 RepID=A0A3S0IJN0_9DEIO|nr:hemolysin family protein [Deinococcus radiophilus]RTR25492.1 HlyC/CorC family transporter [Deinococcus radiophilus]